MRNDFQFFHLSNQQKKRTACFRKTRRKLWTFCPLFWKQLLNNLLQLLIFWSDCKHNWNPGNCRLNIILLNYIILLIDIREVSALGKQSEKKINEYCKTFFPLGRSLQGPNLFNPNAYSASAWLCDFILLMDSLNIYFQTFEGWGKAEQDAWHSYLMQVP